METNARVETPALVLRGVDIGWGAETLLPSLELTLAAGELLCVVGPGRSGKSTLLRVLESIATRKIPAPSDPWWSGSFVAGVDACKRLRQHGEFPRETLRELLARSALGDTRRWLPRQPEARAALAAALDRPLGDAPDPLRRFVSFALIAHDPAPLLLFDEPLFALEGSWAQAVWSRLEHLHRERRSMIIVTHYLPLARTLADRVMLIVDGRVIEAASRADFFERAQHPRTRQYIQWGG